MVANQKKKRSVAMKSQITIEEIEPIRAAYRSYKGDVLKAGKYMPTIFKSIKGKSNGVPFL